jgi:hypothetical protein
MRAALCSCLLYTLYSATASAAPELVVGPYVQDVQADRFTVVFELSEAASATVEAGGIKVQSSGTHHEALVRGLERGGHVRYRVTVEDKLVGGGEVALPDAARPLDFVVFGDTRGGGETVRRLAERAHDLSPELILHTGDVVLSGDSLPAWIDYFRMQAPLLADVPVYPALGNHEVWHDPTGENFSRFFVLPDDGRKRHYYTFRVANSRFVVLDGNAPGGAQTAWLRATLEAADREHVLHVFVLVHQAPFSRGDHCGTALAEPDWVELFEQHRVRAVFAGHDHAYERMERRGVRYFVSGGGGAPLYLEHDCNEHDRAARRVYRAEHHLLHVRVTGPTVEVSALPLEPGAPPFEVVRFSAGEPLFAMEAAALRVVSAERRPWTLGAGCVVFLIAGVIVRRRRR